MDKDGRFSVPDGIEIETLDPKHGTGIVTATVEVTKGAFKGLKGVVAAPFRRGLPNHEVGDAIADVLEQANQEK